MCGMTDDVANNLRDFCLWLLYFWNTELKNPGSLTDENVLRPSKEDTSQLSTGREGQKDLRASPRDSPCPS